MFVLVDEIHSDGLSSDWQESLDHLLYSKYFLAQYDHA